MGLYPNSQCQSQYSVWLARYFQTLTQPYLIIQTKDFDFISNNALSLSLSYKLNLTRHFKYLVLKYNEYDINSNRRFVVLIFAEVFW